jgi:membrane associated rhomboid family serine protease
MIPIHDNIRPRHTPWVNYTLIAICSVVWLVQVALGSGVNQMIERWGLVPVRLVSPSDTTLIINQQVLVETDIGPQVATVQRTIDRAAVPDWLTLVTCVFLHGGWLHVIGNMWFLHIFGDNVEDRLGHGLYAALFVGTGVFAGMTHLATNLDSPIATIGASGAIAGVMGAYLILYPKSQVMAVVPLVFFFPLIVVPAPLFLIVWFGMQFWNGTASIAESSSGVAWWAHIGGFIAGVLVALGLVSLNKAEPPVEEEAFNVRGIGMFRGQQASRDDLNRFE